MTGASSVAEVTRKHKFSQQTIYIWRKKFVALDPAEVKRLRSLEAENAKLKHMVAEREMAIETLKEVNRRNVWSAP
ncbi:MAG: transposase [Verrucomicrobia bacterium]|jgi:putative transposase|nr:transposase [Verrucomicrobiota bacterium]